MRTDGRVEMKADLQPLLIMYVFCTSLSMYIYEMSDNNVYTYLHNIHDTSIGQWLCKVCGSCSSCGTKSAGSDPNSKWKHEVSADAVTMQL